MVISIIALLISLLLPALEGARQAARQVGCQSNLRSVGVAIQLYAEDWDGWLPYHETWYCESSLWPGCVPGDLAVINDYLGPDQFNTAGNVICPSFEEEPPTTTRQATSGNLSSYGYNAGFLGVTQTWSANPDRWIFRKRDEIRHPSDVISDADTAYSPFYGDTVGGPYWPIIHRNFEVPFTGAPAWLILTNDRMRWPVGNRHHDGANAVSLDGHVEWQLQTYWHEPEQQHRWSEGD